MKISMCCIKRTESKKVEFGSTFIIALLNNNSLEKKDLKMGRKLEVITHPLIQHKLSILRRTRYLWRLSWIGRWNCYIDGLWSVAWIASKMLNWNSNTKTVQKTNRRKKLAVSQFFTCRDYKDSWWSLEFGTSCQGWPYRDVPWWRNETSWILGEIAKKILINVVSLY